MKAFFLLIGNGILNHPAPFLMTALAVNLIAFCLYGIDKHKARHKRYRISEATLLLFPALGGGIGALLGMTFFRHKTKHVKFLVTVPCLFLFYTAFFVSSLLFALLSSYGT